MARKRHTPEQIIRKLREAEVELAKGQRTADAVRKLGITEQTSYRWRKEYGGLRVDQAKRENGWRKKLGLLARPTSNPEVHGPKQQQQAKTGHAQRREGGGGVGHPLMFVAECHGSSERREAGIVEVHVESSGEEMSGFEGCAVHEHCARGLEGTRRDRAR